MWGVQWGTGQAAVFSVQVPKIDAKFTGTGDLTAALLLARAAEFPDDMPRAVRAVMASLHVVCKATAEAPASLVGPLRELQLIACIDALRSPPDLFEAEPYIVESYAAWHGFGTWSRKRPWRCLAGWLWRSSVGHRPGQRVRVHVCVRVHRSWHKDWQRRVNMEFWRLRADTHGTQNWQKQRGCVDHVL